MIGLGRLKPKVFKKRNIAMLFMSKRFEIEQSRNTPIVNEIVSSEGEGSDCSGGGKEAS